MKHYTLAEHHTFCVESEIPNGEVWREVTKLGWLPEGIYHDPDQSFNPERKARRKKRQLTPEYKAKFIAYRDRPEFRAILKTPEYKARRKEYAKRYYWKNKK